MPMPSPYHDNPGMTAYLEFLVVKSSFGSYDNPVLSVGKLDYLMVLDPGHSEVTDVFDIERGRQLF